MGNIMGKISQYCSYDKFLDIYYISKYDDYKNEIIKDKTLEELIEIIDLVNNHYIVSKFYDHIYNKIFDFKSKLSEVEDFLNDDSITSITKEEEYAIDHSLTELLSNRMKIKILVKDCNDADDPIYKSIWKIVSFDDIWETYGDGRELAEFLDEEYGMNIFNKVRSKVKKLISE